jgi:hypothetical protein
MISPWRMFHVLTTNRLRPKWDLCWELLGRAAFPAKLGSWRHKKLLSQAVIGRSDVLGNLAKFAYVERMARCLCYEFLPSLCSQCWLVRVLFTRSGRIFPK